MTEIRVQGEGTPLSETHPGQNLAAAGAEPLPPGHALPGEPVPVRTAPVVSGDPEIARAEIEQTRARMSETIDEIEDALTRKKEQIQDRLDVLAPVRERPLAAAGAVFGVGLLLGLLTGGDDDDEHEELDGDGGYWRDRSAEWEGRARRLLRVARGQEEEMRELSERYGDLYAHEIDAHGGEHLVDEDEAVGALRSTAGGLRDTVLHGVTGVLTDAFRSMARAR